MARLTHCKGRRHRLNYKKKIDPSLKVELPKSVAKSLQKRKEKRITNKKNTNNGSAGPPPPKRANFRGPRGREQSLEMLRREEARELAYRHHGRRGGYHDDYYPPPPPPPRPPPHFYYEDDWIGGDPHWEPPSMMKNPADDKLLASKCGQLYPTEAEAKASQKTVHAIESALKSVSDDLLVEKCKRIASEKGQLVKDAEIEKDESLRELKGVMRVGLYANNLLLRGSMDIQLVVMCASIPTRTLLHEILDSLPAKLHSSGSDRIYHVTSDPKSSKLLVVTVVDEATISVSIIFTSSILKNKEEAKAAPSSALDIQSCLAGLTALQQTKWFQAMCQGLPSLGITMRIFLDLRRRNPVWAVLDEWLLLVLIQKCIVSAGPDYVRPGDIVRRVIECIASGVFLPGYMGLLDPCDSDSNIDIAGSLTAQQRADITLSAQHFLRLIAFNQLHLVLDVQPPDDYAPYNLKRNWSPSKDGEGEEEEEEEEGGGKGEPIEPKRFKLDHI